MAMPKKGSRALVVDGHKYRWGIRRTEQDTHWNEYGMENRLTISVENYENPASMLCISYFCGGGYDGIGPNPRLAATGEEMKITPSDVEQWIRTALGQGWKPETKGAKFLVEL